MKGYDSSFVNPYRVFNLKKAKELLMLAFKYAGIKNPDEFPALEYAAVASGEERKKVEIFEKALKDIGLKLHVTTYSWPEFQNVIKNAKAQMWSLAWRGDYPDASNYYQLFLSNLTSPGPNDSRFSNLQYDRFFAQRNYKKMNALLAEEVPYVFLVHRSDYYLMHSYVKNVKLNPFSLSDYKYYIVDRKNSL